MQQWILSLVCQNCQMIHNSLSCDLEKYTKHTVNYLDRCARCQCSRFMAVLEKKEVKSEQDNLSDH